MTGEILVMDENPGVQRALKRFLSQNGYSVVAMDNIQDAINFINQSSPFLVILDIKMPNYDGLKLINLIRKSGKMLPIIVMTAYPTFFTREEALKIGIAAYVTKPFDSAEILHHIQQLS